MIKFSEFAAALLMWALIFALLIAVTGCASPLEEAVKCHREGEKINAFNLLPITARWSC